MADIAEGSLSQNRSQSLQPWPSIQQTGDYSNITVQGSYNDVGRDQYNTYISASRQTIEQSFERIAGGRTLSQHVRSLPRADSAAWNSYTNAARPTCFEGTRATVLDSIYTWIASPEGSQPQIYVLDGLAGIGKSTVARTVAAEAYERGWLGASFFFSRHEDERKSGQLFFGTIAFQLSVHFPDYSRSIGEALESNPDAAKKQLQDQLRELIIQPLTKCTHASTVVIVVDALDECKEQDAKQLLSLFLQEIRKLPQFKVLFTTRPERHILNTLLRHNTHQLYRLHDVEDSVVESDVRSYLNHGLSSQAVEEALPELEPPPWTPSLAEFNTLVNAAGKLFIVASIAIKFLLDDIRCNPEAQMTDLMRGIAVDNTGSNPFNMLDRIYSQILNIAIPSKSPPAILSRFHSVVGTIVLLQDPLPLQPLASLLQTNMNDVKGTLIHIQSIISLSGLEKTPRIYHKSFPDFITDADRCSNDPRFHVSVGVQHACIARSCFRVMDEQLRANICDLKFPEKYLENAKIQSLCGGRISSELQYACIHWATHLRSADVDEHLSALLDSFSFTHILHWLEVLSLIGRLEVAYPALGQAMGFLATIINAQRITEILNDVRRLLSQFYSIIESSALHLYHTVLSLIPPGTLLHQTYSSTFPNRIIVTNGVQQHWSPLVTELRAHTTTVSYLSFSLKGSRLASGSGDSVRLWDGVTGGPIATLEGHLSRVSCLSFSSEGSRLASGSSDGILGLWNGATGLPIATLTGHSSTISSLSFSHDGSRLASGSYDFTVRLWSGATGLPIATLKGHSRGINALSFSPDGSRLASASDDHTVRMWNGDTGVPISILEGHSDSVWSLSFSPDGSQLASGSFDSTVRIWDGATGASIASLEGHSSTVSSLAFSPDSSRLASGSQDTAVRLWDSATGVLIAILEGHSDSISSLSFSPDGSRLASGSQDATVKLWDGATGVSIVTLEGHSSAISSLSFSPEGSRLASGSKDTTVRLWDATTGVISSLEHHSYRVSCLLFSPDGSRLASGSFDSTVILWDGATGLSIATLKGHSSAISSLSFSSDGSRLASGSEDAAVRLWDGATGVLIAVIEGHSDSLSSLSFSPDGSRLASGSRDATLRLWDGTTGASIATLNGHSCLISYLLFSHDGSRLASGSYDFTVRLWDGATGASVATLDGHSSLISYLSFSPDGSRLASSSCDHTVRLWDGATGASIATIATLEGHSSILSSLSEDGAVRLWDGATAGSLSTLTHAGPDLDLHSSSTVLYGISVSISENFSKHCYIQGNVPDSNNCIPLLWLPVDTAEFSCQTFCGKAAAFGYDDGRVIILDLGQLTLQEAVVT